MTYNKITGLHFMCMLYCLDLNINLHTSNTEHYTHSISQTEYQKKRHLLPKTVHPILWNEVI